MTIVSKIRSTLFSDDPMEIYMGDVAVASRSNFIKFLEVGWETSNIDEKLQRWINELLPFPPVSKLTPSSKTAVRLDVLISNYKCGTDAVLWIQPILPLAWRPSVKLHCRLVRVDDNKTVATFNTKKVLNWSTYFSRVFNIKNIFFLQGSLHEQDMKELLGRGLIDFVVWLKKYA